MITLYGLRNCDSCRKARVWLDPQGLAYRFHDFRADGLEPDLLERLEAALGWETLLNRRGTTWRTLAESERAGLGREQALRLMLEHPTLVKRPILARGDKILIGFTPARYLQEL